MSSPAHSPAQKQLLSEVKSSASSTELRKVERRESSSLAQNQLLVAIEKGGDRAKKGLSATPVQNKAGLTQEQREAYVADRQAGGDRPISAGDINLEVKEDKDAQKNVIRDVSKKPVVLRKASTSDSSGAAVAQAQTLRAIRGNNKQKLKKTKAPTTGLSDDQKQAFIQAAKRRQEIEERADDPKAKEAVIKSIEGAHASLKKSEAPSGSLPLAQAQTLLAIQNPKKKLKKASRPTEGLTPAQKQAFIEAKKEKKDQRANMLRAIQGTNNTPTPKLHKVQQPGDYVLAQTKTLLAIKKQRKLRHQNKPNEGLSAEQKQQYIEGKKKKAESDKKADDKNAKGAVIQSIPANPTLLLKKTDVPAPQENLALTQTKVLLAITNPKTKLRKTYWRPKTGLTEQQKQAYLDAKKLVADSHANTPVVQQALIKSIASGAHGQVKLKKTKTTTSSALAQGQLHLAVKKQNKKLKKSPKPKEGISDSIKQLYLEEKKGAH